MVIVVILLALAFLAVLAVILLRRAGGGRFPWFQFYMKGRESGFVFREINLLRRVSVDARLENPTALFWSVRHLDRALKTVILQARARAQDQDAGYNLLLAKLFELRKRVEFDQPRYKLGIRSSRKLVPKQALRITLPGIGPFTSTIIENLVRYMAISYPRGPKLPEGFSWRNQKIGVYFWRTADAGYFFQTRVLDDFSGRQYPILHVQHSDNLIRTQKRDSVRVDTDLLAELFPLQSIDQANEVSEGSRGLRCRIIDLSEGGAAVLIGGKARSGLPVKLQFSLGEDEVVVSGVVKGVRYDQAKNRSVLHVQAASASAMTRNRILTYVYNLFGERETVAPGKPPVPAQRPSDAEGIVLRAQEQGGGPAEEAEAE